MVACRDNPNVTKGYHITNLTKNVIPPNCTQRACTLNLGRKPIALQHAVTCHRVQDCVTVNVKTRHRYTEVKRFINSIYQYYPGLRVVVMDELEPTDPEDYRKWMTFLDKNPQVRYAQTTPGVGHGRKLAAMLSETPYVLVADDDYVFSLNTNISKLSEVLQRSGADIVAGATSDKFPFAGAFRINPDAGNEGPHLVLYAGVFHGTVPCFQHCYVADIVKTFFLANRNSILSAGSWDSNRPFYEHEDFFYQMRKRRLSVVYCDDVVVQHAAMSRHLAALRHKHYPELRSALQEKWELGDYYLCKGSSASYMTSFTCPTKARKRFQ